MSNNVIPFPPNRQAILDRWYTLPAGFRIKFTPLYEDEDGLHVKVLWDPRAPRPVPRKVRRALQTISENLLVETGAEVMALASGRAPALAEALFGRPL